MKKKIKVLIIGHRGLVGKNIFTKLKEKKSFLVKGISSKEINFLGQDSIKKMKKYQRFEILIFCSAIKSDFGNNFKNLEQNITMINNFVKGININKIKKLIYFSSNAIYGVHLNHNNIDEKGQLVSDTPYSLSKYYSEKILEMAFKKNEKKLVLLRPTIIFGSGEKVLANNPYGFFYKMMKGHKIKLWGKGEEIREFLYIEDLSMIIFQIIKKNFFGILNIGGFRSSYINVINKISKIYNLNGNVIFQKRTTKKVNKSYNKRLLKKVYPSLKITGLESSVKKLSIKNS
jgi:UDP-glucose 4-epimerase